MWLWWVIQLAILHVEKQDLQDKITPHSLLSFQVLLSEIPHCFILHTYKKIICSCCGGIRNGFLNLNLEMVFLYLLLLWWHLKWVYEPAFGNGFLTLYSIMICSCLSVIYAAVTRRTSEPVGCMHPLVNTTTSASSSSSTLIIP